MAGGRRIPVTVDADTSGDFDKAADGLDKVAKKGDDADKSLRRTSKGAQVLDGEITKTKSSIEALRAEFAKTGDIDLLKDAKKLEGNLKGLERLKQGFADAGEESGKTFAASLQGVLKSPVIGPVLTGVLIGGAIAAAPAIGAAVASGVTLGVSGAVLAGGIMVAAKDPRVADAWGSLGDSAMEELKGAADVFVVPLIGSAHKFGDVFSGEIMPHLRKDFDALVPYVDKLTDGVAGFASNMMPGVDALVEAAGPFLDELAAELPNIGNAAADFFQSISAGGPGAVQFFHDLLIWTEKGIVAFGNIVEFLSKTYALFSGLNQVMTGDLSGALRIWEQFGDKGKDGAKGTQELADSLNRVSTSAQSAGLGVTLAADDFTKLSQKIAETAQTSDMLAGQMVNKVFTSMMSLDQATLGFAESQTKLGDALKENGRQLDIHTEKGQANREAILGAISANMQQYQANINAGMSAVDAAKAYDSNTQALERQLQKAGFTQSAIDGLIGKYRSVPDDVNTDIATRGLTEAINDLSDLIRRLNGLDGRVVKMTVQEIRRTTYTSDVAPSGYFKGLAKGGMRKAQIGTFIPPSNPGTVLTGEPQTGGEWLIPAQGLSDARAMSLGRQAMSSYNVDVVPRQNRYAAPAMAGGGGGGTRAVELRAAPGDQVAEVLLSLLRPTVRGRYGGDVGAAMGGAN